MLYHVDETVEGFVFNLYGDRNQCDAVEVGSQITRNYTDSLSIREMCPNLVKMNYIPETGSYDQELNSTPSNFLKRGKLNRQFEKPGPEMVNILNRTSKNTNKLCAEEYVQTHKPESTQRNKV